MPGARVQDRAAVVRERGHRRSSPGRHGHLLFDQQLPARPARHLVRELPDQAGGGRTARGAPGPEAVRDALSGAELQALAVSGSRRALALPNVPTIAEAGYPEATYNFWVGLFAPSKTPPPIIERIYQETAKALQGPTLKERFVRLGFDAMPLDRPAFAKLIQDEFILNTKVAKAAGVAAN